MFNMTDDSMRGCTRCNSCAGVAIGSTATKVKFAASNGAGIEYAIDGLAYYKADTDDCWTLSGDVVAAGKMCIFLLQLNASGTMSIVQGTAVSTSDVDAGNKVVPWPTPTEGTCPIGAVLVETATGYTFTPGTTNLSATGITDTYFNFDTIPTRGLDSAYCA